MRLNVAIGLAFLLGLCIVVLFDTLGAIPKGGRIYGLVGAICLGIIGLQCLAARLPEAACKKLNVQRKAQHIATGLALTAVFLLAPYGACVLALGAGTTSLCLVQLMRLASKEVDQEFLKVFGAMLKEEEWRPGAGFGGDCR